MLKTALILTQHALTDRRGVTAAEYAVLAAGIILAVAAAVTAFGPKLTAKFTGLV